MIDSYWFDKFKKHMRSGETAALEAGEWTVRDRAGRIVTQAANAELVLYDLKDRPWIDWTTAVRNA